MTRYAKIEAFVDHEIAFVRMPKNGMSSLQAALERVQPYKAAILQGKPKMRELVEDGYEVVAVIREPLDRLLSAWRFFDKTTQGPSVFEGIRISDGVTFEAFCEQVLNHPLHRLDRHFQPQSLILSDEQGFIPTRVLRFENLNEEWEQLRRDTKLPLPPLPHLNPTDQNTRPITDRVIELVHEKLVDDYLILGYNLPHE